MTTKTSRKEQTRKKMIAAAGRSFREFGKDGVGVDAIAKEAGATSGAFYAHLGSKDAAFATALEAGLNEVIDAVPAFQEKHKEEWVEAFATYYLGKPHREDMVCGCAMTALSPDVVRSSDDIRALYEEKMSQIVDLIANGLSAQSAKERRDKAWTLLHLLIGGLTTARAVHSPDLQAKIARAAKRAALTLAS